MGRTGYLVDVDEQERLGDALELLVADRELRARMSLACRDEAVRRFDAQTNADKLYDFVRSRC
jgi:glycosyltransferase involved in cell wall biosynthesis